MRLSLRFLLPLLLVVGLFAYAAVPLADTLMLRWFVRDLDIRAQRSSRPRCERAAVRPRADRLDAANRAVLPPADAATSDSDAVGLCVAGRATPIATAEFPSDLACSSLVAGAGAAKAIIRTAHGMMHLSVAPVDAGDAAPSQLAILHDMSFIERRSEETRRYLFYFFAARAASVALITVVIAQLSWRGWVAGLRALLRGEGILRPAVVEYRAGAEADRPRRAGAASASSSTSSGRATSGSHRWTQQTAARQVLRRARCAAAATSSSSRTASRTST